MWALVKAELVKVTTTRSTFGLMLGAAAVALLGAWSTIGSGEAANLAGPMRNQQFFLLASVNLALFALIAGIRTFTDEFRHGSIVPTFLLAPDRRRVLVAKAVTGATVGAVVVAAAQAVMLAAAILLLRGKGVEPGWSSSDLPAALGLVTAGALWSVIGVGVGAAVRHQVAAIVGAVVWIVVVENLGAGFVGEAGRFLPGQAAHALARVSAIGGDLLSPGAALLVLAAYTLAAGFVGVVTLRRRDVTAA